MDTCAKITCILAQKKNEAGPASSVGCTSAWYADGRVFDSPVRQHSFVKIGH